MDRSHEQEQRGALQHNGRVQPGSGSGQHNKGDVKTKYELIEYKRTDGKAIRVEAADLAKNRGRALVEQRTPLFGIEVGGRDYIIADQFDFDELIERRAREIAGRIILRRTGSGATESEILHAAEMCGSGESSERAVLSGAASVSQGQERESNVPAADGGGGEGLLLRPQIPRGPRVPRAPRVPRLGNRELAEVRGVGRAQRTGESKAEDTARGRSRTSRLIGGDST